MDRDELIRELRTECKLEPMDAQDVSLFIIRREEALLSEIENPLKGHTCACTCGKKIFEALHLIEKSRSNGKA